jgi:3-oxoacyl-[acyl-carrier-protein] synthase II
MREVVVTGVGINCATGRSFPEFCKALREGRPGISSVAWIPVSRENVIAAQMKDIPLTAAGRLRRISRQAIREALADAGLTKASAAPAGFYLASVAGDGLTAERLCGKIQPQSDERAVRTALSTFPLGTLADRLARDFGFAGPRDVNTNACASGNIALGRALHAIRAGRIDIAVVCGADQMKPITYYGADRSNILGPTIKPFHRDRCGTALGDGAGAIDIESHDRALARNARIRAVVNGFGNSCSEDPHEIIPQLDGRGVARCIRAALADAGIQPEDIGYINAHATGTINIEISECTGIRGAFGKLADEIPVSATKSFTAHLSSASAIVELIATVDALETGFLHETAGLDTPDPSLVLRHVERGGEQRPVSSAVSIAMGAGGVNTAVVLSTPEQVGRRKKSGGVPAPAAAQAIWITSGAIVSSARPKLQLDHEPAQQAAVGWTPLSEIEALSGGASEAHYNRAARLALAAVTRLIERAKLSADQLQSERFALIVGTMLGGTSTWSDVLARTYADNPRHITPSMALSHGAHLGATLISRRFGLIGPTLTLTGGVGSGLSALQYAADLMGMGEIDRAIVCSMDIADEPTRLALNLLCGPLGGESQNGAESDAAAALLLEPTSGDAPHLETSVLLAAIEERFAPVGAGRHAPSLAEDAMLAALRRTTGSAPLIRIDGTANFHRRISSGIALPPVRSNRPVTETSLTSDLGWCGAAEPLIGVAAGVERIAASRTKGESIDVAVSACGPGGSASCALLSSAPLHDS